MDKNVVLTRVDFRMIHGQVAQMFIPLLKATRVVIIDDMLIKDTFTQQILTFAAPKKVGVDFYSVEDAAKKYLEEKTFGDGRTIIIFRSIDSAYRAFVAGVDIEELNVGQTPREKNTMHASATAFVTVEDVEKMKELKAKGVDVYFQQTRKENRVELATVLSKLKM